MNRTLLPNALSSGGVAMPASLDVTAAGGDRMTEGYLAQESRSSYLLNGRRVTVADLLGDGLLEPGTRLRFDRPQLGVTYRAAVTDDGAIALEDGRIFRTPSRAAAEAAGMQAVDGWHAWIVDSTGNPLDNLREQLLDDVAGESAAKADRAGDAEATLQPRHDRLKTARAAADGDAPEYMSVRELLDLWGAKGRGYRISQQVEADLANHGLTTRPNFRSVTLDTNVQLVKVQGEEEGIAVADVRGSDVDEVDEIDAGLTVGNLASALGGVTSVSPTATLEEAVTLMLLNDFSQLAVLSGAYNLRGAVSWKSVAEARHVDPSVDLSAAIIDAVEVPYTEELIDVLAVLEKEDFVFVRDETNKIAGIVTTTDVVRAYGELATPFFLIGELDQALRRTIAGTFSLPEVAQVCNTYGRRQVQSFDDLSMGDYEHVLQSPDLWGKLGWPLDRVTFIKRLDELRQIRNDVMHFTPDPLPIDALGHLRNFLKLIRSFGARSTS